MGNKKRMKKGPQNKDLDIRMEDMENVNMNEVTDSDEEYTETEKNLLEKVRTRGSPENYDSDDEVYGLQDEDEEHDQEADSMESDIEGLQEDFDLPDERAWGKKKNAYFSTDYVDPDYASLNQKDLAHAEIEEQEARSIQKRLAEQLDDADFGLDLVQIKKDETPEDEQIIKTDLTKLSKRQKQALMQKESPEFMSLVADFKERMIEARDILAPFLKLVENGTCPDCPAAAFLKTKYHLVLNYCVNISFYLMLKAKRLPVNSHPVIKRLAQYRQLLSQLESEQGNLLEKVQEVLNAEKAGKPLYSILDGSILNIKKQTLKALGRKVEKVKMDVKKKHKGQQSEENENENSLSSDIDGENMDQDEILDVEITEQDKDEMNADNDTVNKVVDNVNENEGKRAITYQIAKNKGLTPHRKKEQRNPRVKHRNKYRKAKIRRKGAVREVRKEIVRYGGEISGIKASVKKSIKLK